ncbi:hypothetical protein [Aurantivibrio plasticivorans]
MVVDCTHQCEVNFKGSRRSAHMVRYAAVCLVAVGLSGQVSADTYTVPRMADGTPDFQGFWHNKVATPFERPTEFGTRRALTVEEAQAISREAYARVAEDAKPTDPDAPAPEAKPLPPVGNYNLFWTDRGMEAAQINGEYRTSILIDPPNGKMPALTESGKERARRRSRATQNDGPEGRSLGERCILSFGSLAGPPMLPTMYNAHYQIVQSPGYVMILAEMVHDARIIPIGDNQQHGPLAKWMGDSIGHWDGDTLVIETTGFREEQSFRGSSANAKITERLTRVADDKIIYRFTVDDPASFAQPFTGELPMMAFDDVIYEYACHEGNYGLPGILQGARLQERQQKQ